ncbi:MAG: hypothetical protein ACREV5_18795 [Steroidobacter sp.]
MVLIDKSMHVLAMSCTSCASSRSLPSYIAMRERQRRRPSGQYQKSMRVLVALCGFA